MLSLGQMLATILVLRACKRVGLVSFPGMSTDTAAKVSRPKVKGHQHEHLLRRQHFENFQGKRKMASLAVFPKIVLNKKSALTSTWAEGHARSNMPVWQHWRLHAKWDVLYGAANQAHCFINRHFSPPPPRCGRCRCSTLATLSSAWAAPGSSPCPCSPSSGGSPSS